METDILPIPVPCISESCIEIKINLNAYFYTSLRCLKRFNEGFQGIHKTFCGTTKKFLPWSGFGTGRVKICILLYQLIFNFFVFFFFFFLVMKKTSALRPLKNVSIFSISRTKVKEKTQAVRSAAKLHFQKRIVIFLPVLFISILSFKDSFYKSCYPFQESLDLMRSRKITLILNAFSLIHLKASYFIPWLHYCLLNKKAILN